MSYGWTIDYIDSLTWPTIKGLMERINEHPPVDFVVMAWLKGKAPKSIGEQIGGMGIPIRKGKVKRRGN